MAQVRIPIFGKMRGVVDSSKYKTCDGHRFISEARKDVRSALAEDIGRAVDVHHENIAKQIMSIIYDTGLWPVERTLLMVPAMYQHEEDFPEDVRNRLIEIDIKFAEDVFESYKKNRPHNYKKYLKKG